MLSAWRVIPALHAPDAFAGEGAVRHGGRWNSRGRAVVYTSEHKSLAALEALAHVDPARPLHYVAIKIEFAETLLERLPADRLPADWQRLPFSEATRNIGDAWLVEARSAVLAVPSVLIPEELNYLLNPAHPDFPKIAIGDATDFTFDPRLLN
jgi:RES domain-containing protein